jgi:hypothetical protein
MSEKTTREILAEADEEKLGYLRGKGWTDEQIAAYLAGVLWTGWRPRMDFFARKQRVA